MSIKYIILLIVNILGIFSILCLSLFWEDILFFQVDQIINTIILFSTASLAFISIFTIFKLDHIKNILRDYTYFARKLFEKEEGNNVWELSDKDVVEKIKSRDCSLKKSIELFKAESKNITRDGKELVAGFIILIMFSIISLIFIKLTAYFNIYFPINSILLFLITINLFYLIRPLVCFIWYCFREEET